SAAHEIFADFLRTEPRSFLRSNIAAYGQWLPTSGMGSLAYPTEIKCGRHAAPRIRPDIADERSAA
ncbi:MAG: hypothetical protein ABR604_04205, partial [Jatrophihabitantaceae bacterium]